MRAGKDTISLLVEAIAGEKEGLGATLKECPYVQKELLDRGLLTVGDLPCGKCEAFLGRVCADDWMDPQDVMFKLHISERTLSTLRANGTLPYTLIGNKSYYLKSDVDRLLRNNYRLFKIRGQNGK